MRTQFLWEGERRPLPAEFFPRGSAWWKQYAGSLRLGAAARKELYDSSRGILALLPDPTAWGPSERPFRGLVVGTVQSGKTASMIGLSAMALDHGYQIVIVLTGSKDDLRRQTARRFNTQLLRRSEVIPGAAGARTIPVEESVGALTGFALPYELDAHQYAAFHNQFQSALAQGRPAVIIIKKHGSSLSDVRRKLDIAYQRFGVERLPTLVLDDECDDASVDRSDMPIPAAIAALWRRAGEHPCVAYVGYTATSAANLLQRWDNDLFPKNFVSLLRHPADIETALTFDEPNPDGWYTGGSTFYGAFGAEPGPNDNFLIAAEVSPAEMADPTAANEGLVSAVRAYLVGGAYRLALLPGWGFDDPSKFPPAHTMLLQTSASQSDHRRWLDGVAHLYNGTRDPDRPDTAHRWDVASVLRDLAENEPLWRRWYDEFSGSRARILEERPRIGGGRVVHWSQVKEQIPRLVDGVRIKVVNSDGDIGSDLDFTPRVDATNRVVPSQDVFTVIIGGAKLSRGITVQGLAVTYFTRWTSEPTEDTVLQLSRWFGFRGPHLEFCRLFTTTDIYSQLSAMDDNDRDLRTQLAVLMHERRSPVDAALVIAANPRALPTAKVGEGKVYDLAFSPFTKVFRHVEACDAVLQRRNERAAEELIAAVRQRAMETAVAASGAPRGFFSRNWTAVEVAEALEQLEYANHNPSAAANPAREYYRHTDTGRFIVHGRDLVEDPYQVAAYLRQWEVVGGAPVFNVGVAYGEMASDVAPFSFALVNREVTASGEVVGGWTGRRAGWRGDQVFDDPPADHLVPGTLERKEGANGLLLMYVIHRHAKGRYGRGSVRECHSPMFGIVIPAGGPIWRRVAVDRRRLVTA